MRHYVLAFILLLSVLFTISLKAEDWPAFRGPQGNGISSEQKVVLQWSATQNILWKVDLPQPSNGSPIVSNGHVFVTTAQDAAGKERSLYCFERENGRQKWVKTVAYAKDDPTHKTNPHGSSTPAANGKHAVVWHGSAGLYCYDFAGNEMWKQELGEFKHMWGYGTSPVIDKDIVILHSGPGRRVIVAGFELQTGKKIWEHEEAQEGDGEYRKADKAYTGSWSTPLITPLNGISQAICMLPTRVVSFETGTGKILWSCDGLRGPKGDLAYSSPILVNNTCVCTGGFNGPGIGFRLGGSGNITEKDRLWRNEKNPQNIGSGIAFENYVYRPNAGPGTLDCLDPKTGESKWTERIEDFWGSMIFAAGHCYVTGQSGSTYVFKPNPEKFELLHKNVLPDGSNATPAISEGDLFIRTNKSLYCIRAAK